MIATQVVQQVEQSRLEVQFREMQSTGVPIVHLDPDLIERMVRQITAREEEWLQYFNLALSNDCSLVEATSYANIRMNLVHVVNMDAVVERALVEA